MAKITHTITHPNGTIEKILINDNPRPIAPSKMIGMKELEDELPDDVLVELSDVKGKSANANSKRASVTRILNTMLRNDSMDVYGSEFDSLMNDLVTHAGLSSDDKNTIIDKLWG